MWPLDGTLTGTNTLGQSEPGVIAMKEYSTLELEPHHQMQFGVIPKTLFILVGES